MLAKPMLSQIVNDEALTRGLGDPEARMLVEWLVDQAEGLSTLEYSEETLAARVTGLCRRARTLVHFVRLWCYAHNRRGAFQLAAVERFGWPLPTTYTDPCELMQIILTWEEEDLRRQIRTSA
jgi:hypothetical protein